MGLNPIISADSRVIYLTMMPPICQETCSYFSHEEKGACSHRMRDVSLYSAKSLTHRVKGIYPLDKSCHSCYFVPQPNPLGCIIDTPLRTIQALSLIGMLQATGCFHRPLECE
ncbi:hypothetical protein PoB_007664500 [Plakobranchus ocellatus]|uniref:Uncharacterized protein n=1 Tax=Plakobranchus ocellatus TaxID=259542 RepID=A0AAV4E156_9GAST|nr:hypothetical protein PoB_007664500 [Plakobranchus ocellatus]